MISEANIPNLMRCVMNNENAPKFNLSLYQSSCGTYGCLVGNDALACRVDVYRNGKTHIEWGMRQYGVTGWTYGSVWSFLFAYYHRKDESKEACLRRLRKFIYYVLHKRELLYDDRGCVRESARRTEGDHHIARTVSAQVASKSRELVNA